MSQENQVEIVLATPALNFSAYASGVYPLTADISELEGVIETLGRNSLFDERPKLKKDFDFRQAIGYGTPRFNADSDEPGYLVYQRTKLNGDQRMVGNLSIGIGGHINKTDAGMPEVYPHPFVAADSHLSFHEIMLNSTVREFLEELGVDIEPTDIHFNHLIIDNENDVGKVHYGLHFFYDTAFGISEFVASPDIAIKGIFSAAELRTGILQKALNAEFENWSQYLIDNVLV